MKLKTFTLRTNLLSKLLLGVALLIGSANVWAQKELPYSYGFENNDIAEEGWTRVSTQSLTTIQTIGSTGFVSKTGSYSFRFYNKTTEDQYLISPLLDDSPTGIDVSFYYNNNATGSYSVEKFSVGYSTTTIETSAFVWDDEVTSNDTEWHHYESSYPNGVKYIAIKYSSASKYRLYIDDINIEITEEYKRPKNLIVTSYTSSSADLSWTAGSDESAWQIAYSTKENFDPSTEGAKVGIAETSYTMSGLLEGVAYYAYVRSKYVVSEETHYSEWSNKVKIIVGDDNTIYSTATSEHQYIPFYGNKVSKTNLSKSQFIVSESVLSDVSNTTIFKLTFYTKDSSASYESGDWGNARFDIYFNTTKETSYSNTDYYEYGTKVATDVSLIVSDYKMSIELDNPFLYSGDNLLISFVQTTVGSDKSMSWYGQSGSYSIKTGLCTYTSSTEESTYSYYFTPRITFTTSPRYVQATLGTNGYATFASPRPLDLTAENLPSGLKAYKADVEGSKVYFTEVDQAVAANTGVLLEGAPEGNYDIPVADSGTSLEGVNDFLVNSIGGTFEAGDYTYYGLLKNSTPLAFGEFNPETVAIPSNKAYVKVTKAAAAKGFSFVFEDTATAIRTLSEAQPAAGKEVFDLSGRKVMNSTLKKGLYIIGGKKMLVK